MQQEEGARCTMKIRYSEIAKGTIVKWKGMENAIKKSDEHSAAPDKPADSSRLLRCTRCEHPQETKWM